MNTGLPHVEFRPWRAEDIPRLTVLANDPLIASNMRDGFPTPYTARDAEDFINMSSAMRPVLNFAILADSRVVGGIGYVPGHDVHRISAEIGYWVAPPYWNRGVATQAVRKFSEFVFATTLIIHLHAGIFDFNHASRRVLEKAGYRFVGKMNRCAIKEGNVIGLCHYELLSPVGNLPGDQEKNSAYTP